jgi:hypothetical protein
MKRILVVAGLTLLGSVTAAAQFPGMPVWNSPKGGTGVTINGDMGLPNEANGKGTAFGARASVGLANLTVTGGASTWTPDALNEAISAFGAGLAFRVIGGSLMPVAINIVTGAARSTEAGSGLGTVPAATNIIAGAGVSAGLPTPGVSIEPYVSVTNRWVIVSGNTESRVGVTFGANLGFGMFGVHVAYDTMSDNGTSRSVIGLGAHVSLKAPIGM